MSHRKGEEEACPAYQADTGKNRRDMKTWLVAAITAVISMIAISAEADLQNHRQERVIFAKGASSATIKSQLKGDETVDYVLRAGAGQTLTVTLKTSHGANYYNVLPPNSSDVAMFIGQFGGDFKGILPTDGEYTIRVYLMRSAARRNESSDYTLTVSVTGKPLVPVPSSQDAVIPGTPYHAGAPLTCIANPYAETKPQKCEAFGIRRGFDGTATVEIKQDGKVKRRILFLKGKPVASDSSESMTVNRQGDVTTVEFESGEHYEIFDTLIFGG
ncbi:MAG: hypothetical protein V2J65_29320 [Desulfobacteraceae bacterium]|nr:hypothetical protein [Desulfobacteraceae bacterium]